VSKPKEKKTSSTAGSSMQKSPRRKEKMIRLDDLIPQKNVSGGRQLFGAADIKLTTSKTKKER